MSAGQPNSHVCELFELCDSGHKVVSWVIKSRNVRIKFELQGYLTKTDLHKACPQLSEDEVGFIFSCLDTNKLVMMMVDQRVIIRYLCPIRYN